MEPIILIGGGGHCISCIDVLRSTDNYEIVGILDTPDKVGSKLSDISVIGTDEDIPMLAKQYKNFLISVGQIKSSEIRERIYNIVKSCGGSLPVIASTRSYISKTAHLSEGTIVMHNALINAGAVIGKNCIINSGALIEHEVIIGDFCHISTHAVVNGQTKVGRRSFIGSNSVIGNNVCLPEEIIIAAGACITKSPDETGTYFGNPARKLIEQ